VQQVNSFSLQRSEIFIALAALINPRSVRSEIYGALANQPKHCAPPERGKIGKAWDYKHLAPLERKQLPVLHFQIEFATNKSPWVLNKNLPSRS
jgi:hypothetical protein